MPKTYDDWSKEIAQQVNDSKTEFGGKSMYNEVLNFQFMAITGLYLIATTAGITGQSSWDTLRNEGGNTLTGPVLAANLVLRSVLSLVLAGPIIGLGITTGITFAAGALVGPVAAARASKRPEGRPAPLPRGDRLDPKVVAKVRRPEGMPALPDNKRRLNPKALAKVQRLDGRPALTDHNRRLDSDTRAVMDKILENQADWDPRGEISKKQTDPAPRSVAGNPKSKSTSPKKPGP